MGGGYRRGWGGGAPGGSVGGGGPSEAIRGGGGEGGVQVGPFGGLGGGADTGSHRLIPSP